MPLLKQKKDRGQYNPLARLHPTAVACLAEILSRPPRHGLERPSHEWLMSQENRIAAIPSRLRLRRGNVSTLAAFFCMEKQFRPKLCPCHEELNAEVINWIFVQLNWECTIHADRIRAYWNDLNPDERNAAEVDTFVNKISGIGTLHLSRDEFDHYFGPGLPDDCRLGPVETQCPACSLATIGARADLLMDLRANMIARAKRRTPRLLVFIDAWITCFGEEFADAMMNESLVLAAELRRIRGVVSEKRKARKASEENEKKRKEMDKKHKKRTYPPTAHRGGRPANPKTTKNGSPLPQVRLKRGVQREEPLREFEYSHPQGPADLGDGLYGGEGYAFENDADQEDLMPSARLLQVPVENPFEFQDFEEEEEGDYGKEAENVVEPDLAPGCRLSRVPDLNPFQFQDFTADESSEDEDNGNNDNNNYDDTGNNNPEPSGRGESNPILSPFYAQSAIPAPLNFQGNSGRVDNTASANVSSDGDKVSWVTWTVNTDTNSTVRPATAPNGNAPPVSVIPGRYASTQVSTSQKAQDRGRRPEPLNLHTYASSSVYYPDGRAVSPASSIDRRDAPRPVSPMTVDEGNTPSHRGWSQFRDPFANTGANNQATGGPISSLVSPRNPRPVAHPVRSTVVTPEDSISMVAERMRKQEGTTTQSGRTTPDWSRLYRDW